MGRSAKKGERAGTQLFQEDNGPRASSPPTRAASPKSKEAKAAEAREVADLKVLFSDRGASPDTIRSSPNGAFPNGISKASTPPSAVAEGATEAAEGAAAAKGDSSSTDTPVMETSAGDGSGPPATEAAAVEAAAEGTGPSSTTSDTTSRKGSGGKDKKGGGVSGAKGGAKGGKVTEPVPAASSSKGGGRGGLGRDKKGELDKALQFLFTRKELRVIEERWEAEAVTFEQKAAAVPVDFERTVGLAIRRVAPTKAEFAALLDLWDKDNIGLKKVDFRRQMRGTSVTGLKLQAGNKDIDQIFDSITGGGGAATATVKQLTSVMWPMAQKAGVVDPVIESLNSQAAACRVEKQTVRQALEALEATEAAEAQLRATTGDDAPVVAQLGNLVQKRNMKVGEVIAKWGSVNHVSFREHVRALGVVASDERIDKLFDEMDDDGGGTLDADELKDGLKMLIDGAKSNDRANAALEKQAHLHRKNASAQIAALHKAELVRAERLKVEAEQAAKAEAERLEREAAAEAELKRQREEAEAKKRAEKEALMAQIAAQKKAARGEKASVRGTDGDTEGEGQAYVPQWKVEAEERERAEAQWQQVRKHFKRRWRPPGLHGTH